MLFKLNGVEKKTHSVYIYIYIYYILLYIYLEEGMIDFHGKLRTGNFFKFAECTAKNIYTQL